MVLQVWAADMGQPVPSSFTGPALLPAAPAEPGALVLHFHCIHTHL